MCTASAPRWRSSPETAELEQVAAEQAALGRVATLVAEAVPPGDVFTAVAAEVAGLFDVPLAGLFRYEREGLATVIAGAGKMSANVGRPWLRAVAVHRVPVPR